MTNIFGRFLKLGAQLVVQSSIHPSFFDLFVDEVYVLIVDGYLSVLIGDYLLCPHIHLVK